MFVSEGFLDIPNIDLLFTHIFVIVMDCWHNKVIVIIGIHGRLLLCYFLDVIIHPYLNFKDGSNW